LLVTPDLARQARSIDIDLKKFLLLRRLNAEIEMSGGLVLGRRASLA
jgi:hypothetical protein